MSERRRITALILAFRFALALAAFGVAELASERVWPASGGMPGWVVVVTMGVVGVLIAVTGRPLARLAGRIVLRDHADGYRAGRALLRRMSSALPVEDVLPALAEITGRTLQVDRSEVRILLDGGQSVSQVWPAQARSDGAPVVVEVRHDGQAVGEIEADVPRTASNREAELLRQLASPAGLAMSTVRLTVELRRRADALRRLAADIAASNRRIARARQTEADTITAEIRARVDPHLRAAEDLVGRAQRVGRDVGGDFGRDVGDDLGGDLGDDEDGRVLIDLARERVGQALDELRNLARRIYPPRLADGGLAAGLEGWQLRTGVGLDLRIGDDPRLRADPAIGSCLYFLIVAALDHRPASGRRQSVRVDVESDRVVVEVVGPVPEGADRQAIDDATAAAVRDRVEAFGGEATFTADDDRRTVRAWLPIDREDWTP